MNTLKEARVILNRFIPRYAISQKSQGANKPSLDYLCGSSAVVDLLNEAFDYQWDFEILDKWNENSISSVNKKTGEEYAQPPTCNVLGKLIVTVFDEKLNTPVTISKTQFGSKVILGSANEQESTYKAAATDALKKCASLIGAGTQLWRSTNRGADEPKYYYSLFDLEKYISELGGEEYFKEDTLALIAILRKCNYDNQMIFENILNSKYNFETGNGRIVYYSFYDITEDNLLEVLKTLIRGTKSVIEKLGVKNQKVIEKVNQLYDNYISGNAMSKPKTEDKQKQAEEDEY